MKFTADVHLHSRYSRATAKNLDLENLHQWAQLKGITVVGTADFTHPAWFEELATKLEPAEEGLFRLKREYGNTVQDKVPKACRADVRFMLSVEISSIYKKGDKTRKVHNIVFASSMDAALAIQKRLGEIGNIRADGRPILGLDCRDLLEIVLETDQDGCLIPAHIWTPHFSALGAKSGFDSIEECFRDLTQHIFAVETGLSSDPPMNWRLSQLDPFTLVSNSDAHSPAKLARECNVLDCERSYHDIMEAWKTGDHRCMGTIEFFPQEGKYHAAGHRSCGVRFTAEDTKKHHGLCPSCGKPVTMGVMDRVAALADRPKGGRPARTHPFRSLIPLTEVLAEIQGVGPSSKKVQRRYLHLLENLGSELAILLDAPLEDIRRVDGILLHEAIKRMRRSMVITEPGYDGVYGRIKLFQEGEMRRFSTQLALFP